MSENMNVYKHAYTHACSLTSIHMSVNLSIHMSMHMSIHMSMHMPIHMSVHLSMHMSIHMSTHMSIHMSIRMSIHTIHMSAHIYMQGDIAGLQSRHEALAGQLYAALAQQISRTSNLLEPSSEQSGSSQSAVDGSVSRPRVNEEQLSQSAKLEAEMAGNPRCTCPTHM